jgi:hypothetical protein
VVDAEEERVLGLPARLALAGGELQHLEEVAVGIAEVERLDAGGPDVPCRQTLRARGRMSHAVLPESRVGVFHVRGDDGDVLKPAVVAAGIHGIGPPTRRQVLRELDALAAQSQSGDACAGPEQAVQQFEPTSRELGGRAGFDLEAEYVDEEAGRSHQIGDGRSDRGHGRHDDVPAVARGLGTRVERCRPQRQRHEKQRARTTRAHLPPPRPPPPPDAPAGDRPRAERWP